MTKHNISKLLSKSVYKVTGQYESSDFYFDWQEDAITWWKRRDNYYDLMMNKSGNHTVLCTITAEEIIDCFLYSDGTVSVIYAQKLAYPPKWERTVSITHISSAGEKLWESEFYSIRTYMMHYAIDKNDNIYYTVTDGSASFLISIDKNGNRNWEKEIRDGIYGQVYYLFNQIVITDSISRKIAMFTGEGDLSAVTDIEEVYTVCNNKNGKIDELYENKDGFMCLLENVIIKLDCRGKMLWYRGLSRAIKICSNGRRVAFCNGIMFVVCDNELLKITEDGTITVVFTDGNVGSVFADSWRKTPILLMYGRKKKGFETSLLYIMDMDGMIIEEVEIIGSVRKLEFDEKSLFMRVEKLSFDSQTVEVSRYDLTNYTIPRERICVTTKNNEVNKQIKKMFTGAKCGSIHLFCNNPMEQAEYFAEHIDDLRFEGNQMQFPKSIMQQNGIPINTLPIVKTNSSENNNTRIVVGDCFVSIYGYNGGNGYVGNKNLEDIARVLNLPILGINYFEDSSVEFYALNRSSSRNRKCKFVVFNSEVITKSTPKKFSSILEHEEYQEVFNSMYNMSEPLDMVALLAERTGIMISDDEILRDGNTKPIKQINHVTIYNRLSK